MIPVDAIELWRYRGVLWRKVGQRIRLQYDDMWLGFFWAVARPLIMMVVFWAFRGLSEARTGVTIPYPLYVYSGLVFWFFFMTSTRSVAASLSRDASLIQKVYYPRIISPISYLLAECYGLLLAAFPLLVMMWAWDEWPGWRLLLFPVVMGQFLLLDLGLGLIFSALSTLSRDWERFLQFALYTGLWVSPVIYSLDMIPIEYQRLYLANPMAGSLLGLRSTLFDQFAFPWFAWLYAVACTLGLLLVGLRAFGWCQRTVADRL